MISRGIAAFLFAPLSVAVAAPVAGATTDDSELIYECAVALDFAAKKGVKLDVTGNRAMAQFGEVTGNDAALRQQAERAIDAVWKDQQAKSGREGLERYILGVARDCSDLYVELDSREAAAQEGQLNAFGTLTAGSLRAYAKRSGDYAAVADYLVYHYPYGKDLFQDNADGDYLGQLIVEIGAAGVRRLSDEAVYAIANKHYWQYNPPATRLVFAEYQRRMRMNRQSESDAQRWAQRAADDRAKQARESAAKPVGSLGRGCEKRALVDQRGIQTATYTVCR